MDKIVEDVYNWKFSSQTHKCSKCGQLFHTNSTLRRHSNNCNASNASFTKPSDGREKPLKSEPESQEPEERELAAQEPLGRLEPPLKKAKKEINNNNEQQANGGFEIPTKTVPINEEAQVVKKVKRKNSGSSKTSFKCSFCIYSTSLRHNLERHIRGHKELKNYKCPYCSFSSNGRNIIKAHVTSYHSTEGDDDPIEINQSFEINQPIEQDHLTPSISTHNESQGEVTASDESLEDHSDGLEAAALIQNSTLLVTIDESLDEPKEDNVLKDEVKENRTSMAPEDNNLVNSLNLVPNVHRSAKNKWTLRAFREINK